MVNVSIRLGKRPEFLRVICVINIAITRQSFLANQGDQLPILLPIEEHRSTAASHNTPPSCV